MKKRSSKEIHQTTSPREIKPDLLKFDAKNPRHCVVVSDIHAGCRMALCPRGGVQLDDGGFYKPSPFQHWLNDTWEYFWNEYVPRITEGEPYNVVINGEAIDGVHHGSVTQWSQNLADQTKGAIELLKPIVDRCKGRVFLIRGTEAHSGKSGAEDERVGREIGTVPNSQGQFARYELWLKLGGGLVHFNHHIGTTGSSAYESTAVFKELNESFVEAGRWGEIPPDVIVRSHRHRHILVEISSQHGKATAVVTPGWQGKTPFAFKVAGARQSQPQFGGIVLSWSRSENFIYERHYVRHLKRDKPE